MEIYNDEPGQRASQQLRTRNATAANGGRPPAGCVHADEVARLFITKTIMLLIIVADPRKVNRKPRFFWEITRTYFIKWLRRLISI